MARERAQISVTDVARRAGVSLGTVSRVMNRAANVAPELRQRVLIASRELGFSPRQTQRCIALVTGRRSPALPVGYVSVMTSLLWEFLAGEHYRVELIDAADIQRATELNLDGVIGVVFDAQLAALKSIPNLPLLTINNPMIEQGIHSVRTNHYQHAALAMKHLLERGHQRIGFLAIQEDEWGSRERLRGYRDALSRAGIPFDPAMVQYTLRHPLYDILNRWMGRQTTAILNFSEDVGLETLHILTNVLKLRIGRDISTISLEDLPIYQYLQPPQTTVRQPLRELARLAVETMRELVGRRDESDPGQLVDLQLPSELVERDSVMDLRRQER